MDKYRFCQFKPDELEQLSRLLSSVFETSFAELVTLYLAMAQDLEKPNYPIPFVKRGFFRSSEPSFQEIYHASSVVSVDLPSVWELDNGVLDKPTVVLIGQDPKMRHSFTDLVIGTPYGLHHKDTRAKETLAWAMIREVIELGFRVYLTDIYKLWVCNPTSPYSGNPLSREDQARFLSIVKQEVSLQNPMAVMTWGRQAERTIQDLTLPCKHLTTPHPSSSANGTWAKLIGSAADANKLRYWRNFLQENLASAI